MFKSLNVRDKLIVGTLLLSSVFVLYLLYSAQEADEDWETFKARHHCQSVGQAAGNNQGGWRCDDGKVYYRWRQQK